MAPSIHLLVNVIGGWKSSSNKTETWQWGVRFRASNVGAADVGTIPTDFVPVATNINRTESAWTITGNWKLQGPTLNNLNIDDWLNDQIAPAVTALMTRAGTASDMETREIRVYPIRSPDGRAEPASPYLSGSPVTLAYTGTRPAGANSGTLPLQNAIVASLRSGAPGRHGRGRFFIPGPTSGSLDTTTGRLSGAYAAAWATAAKTFLEACQIRLTVPNTMFVDAIVTGKPYETYNLVKTVIVDDLVDTQRRRRKSLVGNPASVNLVIP